ncbi:ATP-binding protein [Nocardioides sp. Leaf307]|uniref:ATP-binding protein n=1 Tax=Nocardioides sp. Leaf307 TaxID=1736331 RepID=UPI0007027E03|nr:ATP-binding protein [Nocardioides sp. Leaf307]KQQ42881.1 ATPase [Nocardioides sp. Leaf307]
MPLNRPALSLGSGPRGVQDARRWVVETCRDIGRDELVECTELAVSELVTNALLHGSPPIEVRVRGTVEHPRVEVRDGSPERPVLPTETGETDDDDVESLLLTFGRGLSIVARCSRAWGAEIEADGKTVWFEPAAEFAEDNGAEGVVTGLDQPPAVPSDPVAVSVHGVPLDRYVAFQRHFRELRREVRLLALAHESEYPLAKDLSDLFGDLERQLRGGSVGPDVDRAVAEGRTHLDLDLLVSRAASGSMQQFIDLLDMADVFCREQRLLSLARTPEQRRFQQWYLGEFVRQVAGEEPLPWRDPASGPDDGEQTPEVRRTVVS